MRVIDSFIFYNEFDLLEGRLEYLYEHVDYFILVESNLTFSGKSKPFYFRENMSRYKKYLDKIIYHPFVIDNLEQYDFEYKPKSMDLESSPWKIEHLHRQEIINKAKIFSNDDFLIVSDCDEVPTRQAINNAKNVFAVHNVQVIALMQDMFFYSFSNKALVEWAGSIFLKNSFAQLLGGEKIRMMRYEFPRLYNSGFHFNNWLDPDRIKTKLESFSHQEYNNDYIKDINRITDRIKQGLDLVEREIPIEKCDPSKIDSDIYEVFKKYQAQIV